MFFLIKKEEVVDSCMHRSVLVFRDSESNEAK